MQDNIQVLISIDVEPDERLLSVTKPEPWRGQEYLFQRVEMKRSISSIASGWSST